MILAFEKSFLKDTLSVTPISDAFELSLTSCFSSTLDGIIFLRKMLAIKKIIPYRIKGALYPPNVYKTEPMTGAIVTPSPEAISRDAMTSV